MIQNRVWAFYYNPMTEESAYGLISLHYTEEGATKAMKNHKATKKREWIKSSKILKFGQFEAWAVESISIKP